MGSARRRAFTNLVGEQLSVGLTAAMAGAILLLLIGTQILDWWWPFVLFVAGSALSAWRTMKLLPSPYSVAQTVDRRLELKDSLSTAFHFLHTPAPSASPELVAAQCAQAEQAAAGVDIAAAVPWRAPRKAIPALALTGVALTLFLVRYGTSGQLDLRKPIIASVADFFQLGSESTLAQNGKAPKITGQDPLGIEITNPDQDRDKLNAAPDDALQVVDTPDPNAGTEGDSKLEQQQVKAAGDQQGDDLQDSTEEGDRSAASKPNSEPGGDGESGKAGEKASKDQKGDQSAKQAGGENSSLMDKMRDAMANLMAKMKIPQQPGSGQKQQASNQKGGQKQQGKQDPGGSGQKGEKGQGNPQGKGGASDDPESKGDEAGEQQAQAGQGQSNDKGQEGGSPNEAKAGMGKQDGNKDIKDAEQKAAMGKLSEIYGKRAENIKGDVMVEVTSSKQQQLRTGYTQRGATHADTGGEVGRDEIPQHLQHFVQQYFEQVRKGETTVMPPAPPAAPAGPAK